MLFEKLAELIRNNLKTYTMILALAFIWLLFGFLTDWIFFSPRNLSNLFRQMTIVSFLSIGMVLVIVTGNIDLSVGSAVGLVSAITAWLQAIFLPPIMESYFPGMDIALRGLIVTTSAIGVGLFGGAGNRGVARRAHRLSGHTGLYRHPGGNAHLPGRGAGG